jgi:predicted nucleic-acid-binding protein
VIGLDTNVLVRLLVLDDRHQTETARRIVAEHCSAEEPGFVNLIVLCECVWVLKSTYGYTSSEIARVIEVLLQASHVTVEAADLVRSGLRAHASRLGDFTDVLLAEVNSSRGCEWTATFDKRAAKIPGFQLTR